MAVSRDLQAPAKAGYPAPDGRTLTGQWCELVRAHPDHGPALHAAFNDRDWDYMAQGPFADSRAFQSWFQTACDSTDPLFYTITVAGRPEGVAALMRTAAEHGVTEVGNITFGAALKRSAAATEAAALLMGHVFDDLGYRRYEWKCNAANAPSRRAAQRLGFSFEGIFRKHMVIKGHNRDTAWFSILDDEWPAQKARFARWLAPDNFDANGVQKTSLAGEEGAGSAP